MKFKDSVFHRILAEELPGLHDPAVALGPHLARMRAFLASLPPASAAYAYAPGKWTVAQVIGHLCDTQVVFLSRILFLARGAAPALPGFDENAWIETSGHAGVPLAALADLHGRGAALAESLVASLPAGMLDNVGNANGLEISAREVLSYLIAHEMHHVAVLRDRYL